MAVHRKLSERTRQRLAREAADKALRDRAQAINAAAMRMAEDPGLNAQGLGTGFHWDRPKFQRTSPKKANNPLGRRAHPRTDKLTHRPTGMRVRNEKLHAEVQEILDNS
jgi:hypothetical protein